MPLYLLDDSLSIDVFYEKSDDEFTDNICLHIWESCPEEEKIFIADETNLYLTPDEARQLAQALLEAAKSSRDDRE